MISTPDPASASSTACAKSAPGRDAAGLADTLQSHGVEGRRGLAMRGLDRRHIGRRRNQVVHERRVQELSLLVVHQLLVEGVADAVRHAAVDLPFDDQSG